MKTNYNYLFGPVPSRRLGRSLGIDVTPFKTCSFDCLFCQLGCTTRLETERGEFVPFDEVCREVENWLAEDGVADMLTFAGSGEPTLYSRLGELIDFIKSRTKIPVMVLSNGTLLDRVEVRTAVAKADIVKVSLSAWDDESFETVNRPARGLTFEKLLEGEREFRAMFHGQLWVEVFLMEGVNAELEQVQKMAQATVGVRPDKIHLNTAVRPPAEAEAQPVALDKMKSLCDLFSPRAEVIASFEAVARSVSNALDASGVVGLIRRHPATAAQLADLFGANLSAVQVVLTQLLDEGKVQTEVRDGDLYYK